MSEQDHHSGPDIDRHRRKLTLALASSALASPFLIPRFAQAKKKHRLRILQYTHFVPEYDRWFEEQFVREWGEKTIPRSPSTMSA